MLFTSMYFTKTYKSTRILNPSDICPTHHIIYFPSVNPYRITQSIWIWKSSYLLGLRGDINTSVYNNHMVISYDKYNKIGQYQVQPKTVEVRKTPWVNSASPSKGHTHEYSREFYVIDIRKKCKQLHNSHRISPNPNFTKLTQPDTNKIEFINCPTRCDCIQFITFLQAALHVSDVGTHHQELVQLKLQLLALVSRVCYSSTCFGC